MEKIKSIISGNKNSNETTTHQTEQTTGGIADNATAGHTTGLTGEGSHFDKAHNATSTGNNSGITGNNTTGAGTGNTQSSGIGTGNIHDGIGSTQHSALGSGNTNTGIGNNQGFSSGHEDPTIQRSSEGGIINTQSSGITSGQNIGQHEHQRDNLGSTTHGTSGLGSSNLGNTGHSGPHTTEAANRLDPTINKSGLPETEDATRHYPKHGAGVAQHERQRDQIEQGTGIGSSGVGHSTGQHESNTGSHHGRNAAIGAGGAGLVEHKHNEHQQGAVAGLDGPAPNTAGPHKQDWLNKLDPRVNANPETATTGSGPFKASAADYPPGSSKPYDPTTGYIANPAHHGIKSVNPDGSTTKTANPAHHGGSTADHLPGRNPGLAAGVGAGGAVGLGASGAEARHNKTDSGVGGISNTEYRNDPHSSNLDSDRSKDHHYGRDAAVAGGVGGAAYEADKHHHKHDTEETKDHHKEGKGGLLSFLHRDKNKKYSKEEEAEFDRQEREHNSHKGREPATIGGITAGGTSQYRSDQHHYVGTHDKALPTAPGNHGIGTGAGTQNALAGDNSTGHHTGRDAAALGGAAAVGEHEHNKHAGAAPVGQKPAGSDIGDKLHGVDRNRGVPGASGFPDTEGFGSSTTHGTAQQHHLGRDAAVGAGGISVAEHEHRKHEGLTGHDQTSSGIGSGNQYGNNSGLTGDQYHNTGLGSSGLAGEQEYGKAGAASGLTAHPGHESGIMGNQGLTESNYGASNIGDDRNRLHKEHPAGHVPASGSERERLVGEGERGIQDDTGVANAHSQLGANAGTNY